MGFVTRNGLEENEPVSYKEDIGEPNMSLQNNDPISEILSNLTFQTLALGPDDTTESIEKAAHQAISDLLIQARMNEISSIPQMLGRYEVMTSAPNNESGIYKGIRDRYIELQQLTSKEK